MIADEILSKTELCAKHNCSVSFFCSEEGALCQSVSQLHCYFCLTQNGHKSHRISNITDYAEQVQQFFQHLPERVWLGRFALQRRILEAQFRLARQRLSEIVAAFSRQLESEYLLQVREIEGVQEFIRSCTALVARATVSAQGALGAVFAFLKKHAMLADEPRK